MKSISFAFTIFCLSAAAQTAPDYFPLAVGNQWVYQASLGSPRVVEVTGVEVVNNQTYFVVTGLNGKELLRPSESGTMYVYDSESGQERVWIDFAAPDQVDRASAASPCSTTAAVASRRYSGRFNIGEFDRVTQVRFGGNVCADAGLTADYYLPNIGLLRRTEQSFTGPRNYELVYARVNGFVMVTGAERSFLLATDAVHYPYRADQPFPMRIRLNLRNQSLLPVDLRFSSGQEYDLIIRTAEGTEVYRWSSTRTFIQATKTLTINGEKNWADEIRLADATGKALPPGRYSLEAVITTTNMPQYRTMIPFEIDPPANN